MPTSRRPYTFDRVFRIVGSLALAVGAIWLIGVLRDVLLPFALACLVAYMLEPLVDFNRRWLRTRGRVVAVFLTLVEVTCVIGLLVYFCVPSVIKEVRQLEELLGRTPSDGSPVPFVPADVVKAVRDWVATVNLREMLSISRMEALLDSGSSIVGTVLDALFRTLEWLLAFIYIIFIMIDYHSLMNGFRNLVPVRYRKSVYRIADDIKVGMNRYFRGQGLIAACAAVFYCIGFSIVGIPLAIVLGILVGILYMIPYFQYVTLIPVALVCIIDSMTGAVHFWPEFGECILVYVVSQCICDYILTPKIMGKAMGLNPAVILLSLSVWGTLLGLIGMIIALPMTALLLSYYQEYFINGADASDSSDRSDDLTSQTRIP